MEGLQGITIVAYWEAMWDSVQGNGILTVIMLLVIAYLIACVVTFIRLRVERRRRKRNAEEERRRQRIRERLPESTKDVQNHWEGFGVRRD